MARILISFICTLYTLSVSANSCCGQNPASFTVLSLNQKLSVLLGYSYTQSIGLASNSPKEFYIFSHRKREFQSMNFNLAGTLGDRHQWFINSSLMAGHFESAYENQSTFNGTDTLVGYNYELLPEYRFSYWKPVITTSLIGNIPTGKSIHDNIKVSDGTGVTGHNQWGLGLGLTLRKTYYPLTLTLQMKTLQIFPKTFSQTSVSSYYDSSLAFLMSYSSPFWQLTIHSGWTLSHLSERQVQPLAITSQVSQNTTFILGLQRSFTEQMAFGLNYTDQTLFGQALNMFLNRGINFNLNYNYF